MTTTGIKAENISDLIPKASRACFCRIHGDEVVNGRISYISTEDVVLGKRSERLGRLSIDTFNWCIKKHREFLRLNLRVGVTIFAPFIPVSEIAISPNLIEFGEMAQTLPLRETSPCLSFYFQKTSSLDWSSTMLGPGSTNPGTPNHT